MDGTEIVIKIDMIYLLGIIGLLITFAWFGSAKFSSLETSVNWIKEEIKKIWDELRQPKVSVTNSPIRLNEMGEEILRDSGIKEWLDGAKPQLMDLLKEKGATRTGYDVQETIKQIMEATKFTSDWEHKLKDYAFKKGIDLDTIRLVAAIHFRDIALEELGIPIEDLDKK